MSDRERIKSEYIRLGKEEELIGSTSLKVAEHWYGLLNEWTTILCTLSFGIGGAVIPLIKQFSKADTLLAPNFLPFGTLVLLLNGTWILYSKKKTIDEEEVVMETFGANSLLNIKRTRAVYAAYLTGKADISEVKIRESEQLDEMLSSSEYSIGSDGKSPSGRLMEQLAIFLLGISCIGIGIFGAPWQSPWFWCGLTVFWVIVAYLWNEESMMRRKAKRKIAKFTQDKVSADGYRVSKK